MATPPTKLPTVPVDLNTLLEKMSPQARLEFMQRHVASVKAKKEVVDNSLAAGPWIEKYFYIPELRGPMKLAKYQKAVLKEAFRKDPDTGLYVYSTIVWGDIKKSIKSCIAAAVGLKVAMENQWASVYSIANDLKGADSRVGYYMRRAIELNPALRQLCKIRNYRIDLPNHSFTESIPIDPAGEAGSNADMIVFSELWGAHEEAQTRMWTEMTTPPNKFGKSMRWVETYAGYSGESLLLEQLWLMATRHPDTELVDVGIEGLELYANRPARLLCLWNTTPRLSWQTPAYYREQEAILPPNEYQRVHRNQWVSSTEEFVSAEQWRMCDYRQQGFSAPQEPELKTPCVFGIDAGVSNDHFGIVGVFKRGSVVHPFYAKEWVPPKAGKINFAEPEKEIRRLAQTYNIIEWAYDEYQLHDMTTRLRREGIGYFRPFPQGGGDKIKPGRPVADKLLYDVIAERRVVHNALPVLTEHVLNANAMVEGQHERLRLVKRSPILKIDCAVCLSMATAEALRLNISENLPKG